jgi:hypothetical protein
MEAENKSSAVLTSLGASVLMVFMLIMLIWSYYYDGRLFVSFIALLYLIYTIIHIIYVSLNANNLSLDAYNVMFGSAIYMAVICLGILVLFTLKFFGSVV